MCRKYVECLCLIRLTNSLCEFSSFKISSYVLCNSSRKIVFIGYKMHNFTWDIICVNVDLQETKLIKYKNMYLKFLKYDFMWPVKPVSKNNKTMVE